MGTFCGRVRIMLAKLRPEPRVVDMPPVPPAPSPIDEPVAIVVPEPPEATGPSISDRFEEFREQITADLAGAREAESERLNAIEALIAAIKPAQTPITPTLIPVPGPSLAGSVLTTALTALGWTGPPSIVALVAGYWVIGAWRRRRARKASRPADPIPGTIPMLAPTATTHDEYAHQLNQVSALSGLSEVANATLGREYDHLIRKSADGSNAEKATWAESLLRSVYRSANRIHSVNPVPSEPLAS
jgi:hypothetical protein